MAKTATEPNAHRGDLRSRGSHDLGPLRPDLPASVCPRPLLGILAESTGLIVNKGPPRLGWPSAWRRQVARYRGLGDPEAEHEKLAVDAGRSPEKSLAGHLCNQKAYLPGGPGTPASTATSGS